MHRTILFLVVLAAAAITPIVVTKIKSGEGFPMLERIASFKSKPAATKEQRLVDPLIPVTKNARLLDPAIQELLQSPLPSKSMVVEPVVTPLPDVLRFDVSPSFLMQRWPRVSTSLPDLDYDGMRVPVMTGTTAQDFIGSASYYFNRSHQLERIALQGYTNDPEGVVQFVSSTYALKEYAANGQRLYLSYFNGQPLSMLRVRTSTISAQSAGSSEIILELNAPVQGAQLSKESLRFLTSLRDANLL